MKKPNVVCWLGNSIYLNVTNKCSNNCYFCIGNSRNDLRGFNLKLKEDPALTEVISELQAVINIGRWDGVSSAGSASPWKG